MAIVSRPCTRHRTVNGIEYQITYKVNSGDYESFISSNEIGTSTTWTPSGVNAHIIDYADIPDSQHWQITLRAVENGFNGA